MSRGRCELAASRGPTRSTRSGSRRWRWSEVLLLVSLWSLWCPWSPAEWRVAAHSWMSCPPSINPMPGRGGELTGPCERPEHWFQTPTHRVTAGDRLKVGWTSNNHGGGYVRLALVPSAREGNFSAFEQNVLKFTCYGHDQREGMFRYGDCKHPCNARPGCQYQHSITDSSRYDTTITIPYNLPDGAYTLQWISYLGNHQWPYFSCSRLYVTGGDPSMSCATTGYSPMNGACRRAAGPRIDVLRDGTKAGDFCFMSHQKGNVDSEMSMKVPVNMECDPRISCDLSTAAGWCRQEPGMKDINPMHPVQICEGSEPGDGPLTSNTPVPRPVPAATCTDGIRNQEELEVDCGGPYCPQCPGVVPAATCGDRIRNQGEAAVDCGGPLCPPCVTSQRPTCNDQIQNQLESGIDCGGPFCSPCPPPTPPLASCTDSVRDGEEEGVDCGGPHCPPCHLGLLPRDTCDDGIMNGLEEGVDCGGLYCDSCDAGTGFTVDETQEYVDSKMVYRHTADWDTGFVTEVQYTASKRMEGWQFLVSYDSPVDIYEVWSSQMVAHNPDRTMFRFKNEFWNEKMWRGDTMSFGYQARHGTARKPRAVTTMLACSSCSLNVTAVVEAVRRVPQPSPDPATRGPGDTPGPDLPQLDTITDLGLHGAQDLQYSLSSQWYNGFGAEVKVKISDHVDSGWTFIVTYDRVVTVTTENVWNARLLGKSSNVKQLTFEDESWNRVLQPGRVLSFGFQASFQPEPSGSGVPPVAVSKMFWCKGCEFVSPVAALMWRRQDVDVDLNAALLEETDGSGAGDSGASTTAAQHLISVSTSMIVITLLKHRLVRL